VKHQVEIMKFLRLMSPMGVRFLSRKNPNKIDDCMYVRWDGTTSYFFSLGTCPFQRPSSFKSSFKSSLVEIEELRELFGKAELREEESKLDTRELKNRKRKVPELLQLVVSHDTLFI